MSDRPTLATIARLTGVTPITVSRALRDEAGVSGETRLRVLRVAEELGYKPDFFASAMAQRRRGGGAIQGALACLVGHRDRDPRGRFAHYELAFEGIRAQSEAMGFSLEVFWAYEPGLSSRRLHHILQARHIEGCVLMSLTTDEWDFPWDQYCLVQAAANTMRARIDYSAVDYYHATHRALAQIRHRSASRVALVLPPNLNETLREHIVSAYRTFQQEAGGSGGDRLIFTVGQRWSRSRRHPQPEAALCWEAEEAEAARRHLHLAPPDIARLHGLHPETEGPGLFIPYRKLGALAVELLVNRLRERHYGIPPERRGVLLDGTWAEGLAA